jgi:hypothetical protein
MHFQLRKAAVVTTIQLKSTRVRMFQTDNFIFQSIYVFKGSCGESSVYFLRNTFLAIFKEWVSKKMAVRFQWSFSPENFFGNFQGVGVKIAVRFQWSFSTEHFIGNFQGVGVKKIAVRFQWSFSPEHFFGNFQGVGVKIAVRFQWSISKGYFLAIFQGVYTSPAIEIAQLKGISEKETKTELGMTQEHRVLLDWYMK